MKEINKRKFSLLVSWIFLTVILGWLAVSLFNDSYALRLPWVRKSVISPLQVPTKAHTLLPVEGKALAAEAPIMVQPIDAKSLVLSYFPISDRAAVAELIQNESSWNQYAINPRSGACGFFQSLPCSKMGCDTLDNVACVAAWGEAYIRGRYGNARNALAFWNKNNYY